MSDVEHILEQLELRAAHLSGSSFMYAQTHYLEEYTDTPGAPARTDLYEAQADALREFAADLKAAIVSNTGTAPATCEQEKDVRYLFIQEMAGTMTVSVHNSWAELEAREARFDAEHEAYFENNGNGVRRHSIVNISPRNIDTAPDAVETALDVRWVFITEIDRNFEAVIYETKAELDRAAAAFGEEYGDSIASQNTVWGAHKILIPPRNHLADLHGS